MTAATLSEALWREDQPPGGPAPMRGHPIGEPNAPDVSTRIANRSIPNGLTDAADKGIHLLEKLQSKDFNLPTILLGGPVEYDMYKNFRAQLDGAEKNGLFVTELSTLGGDPEVARMMGEDIRFHSENSRNCRFVFLGKAAIYSAGTTFMSFFSIENRYLTRGTRLMIHERKLDKQLQISGPLTTCVATVTAALHEIEASISIQNEGFENLIRGSKVSMEEVLRRAPGNWYIEANEAKSLGLVSEVL